MTTTMTEEFASDSAMSFWPTPAEVAYDLVYWLLAPSHADGEGVRVLEPSAGEGHLIRAITHHLPKAKIIAVEPSAARAAALRSLPDVDVVESTLEDYLVDVAMEALAGRWEPFDLVVMNPPFTLERRREAWAEHVLAVYHDPYLLAPWGLVGAVVPQIVMTGKSKRIRAVRELLAFCGQVEACERGAFSKAGGAKVSAAILWAQKPLDAAEASGAFPLGSGS